MSKKKDSFSLQEAATAIADPDDRKLHEQAVRLSQHPVLRPYFPMSDPSEIIDRYMRRAAGMLSERIKESRNAQRQKLLEQLREGSLVATGVGPDGSRVRIPPQSWQLMEIGVQTSTAAGGGLRFTAVEVLQGGHDEAVTDQKNVRDPALPKQEDIKVVKAGRPSIMPALKAELRRQAEAGRLEPTLAAQVREMHRFAIEMLRVPHDQLPKIKSIEKSLRPEYRKLKADK